VGLPKASTTSQKRDFPQLLDAALNGFPFLFIWWSSPFLPEPPPLIIKHRLRCRLIQLKLPAHLLDLRCLPLFKLGSDSFQSTLQLRESSVPVSKRLPFREAQSLEVKVG
jgi:hypothetical protein